jgi:hypothetical protein
MQWCPPLLVVSFRIRASLKEHADKFYMSRKRCAMQRGGPKLGFGGRVCTVFEKAASDFQMSSPRCKV